MIFWRNKEDVKKEGLEDKVTFFKPILENNVVEIPVRAFDLMKFKRKVEDDGVVILGVEFEGNNISFIGVKEQSWKL